jgi:hypothetical protein
MEENKMKILAVNGSPNGKGGNTEIILKNFLKGCSKAGSDTETIYLKDKNIHHCRGCFTCWTKTPGKCIYNDDMAEIINKIIECDVIVFATPLYYFTVTGLMKDFMDRSLPIMKGTILEKGQKYFHPGRYRISQPKIVLISNCGFPGKYNFSGLFETFKVMCGGKIDASILCDKCGGLTAYKHNDTLKKLYESFFNALVNAGEEFVTYGYIKSDTQALIESDFVDTRTYIENANRSWIS